MYQIHRPRWSFEAPKLVFKGAKAVTFTRKVDSFLIFPNAKKTGIIIRFKCINIGKIDSFFFLNSFHDLEGNNKEYSRNALKAFLKDSKKEFSHNVSRYALINKREVFFKDIDKITVFKKGNSPRYGPRKEKCYLPHYVTQVHFCDGSKFTTKYKF